MKYHQGIRAEIETREAKFNQCLDLGRALLERKHKDSAEVTRHRSLQCTSLPLQSVLQETFIFIYMCTYRLRRS